MQNKKRNVQLVTRSFDAVANVLHKTTKSKKTKVAPRLGINPSSGNLCVEIAQPIVEKDINEANEADFSMTQLDLGPTTHDGAVHNFQISAAILIDRENKDKETKDQLKQQIQVLSSYIKSILDSSDTQLESASTSTLTHTRGLIEKKVIEDIHKCRKQSRMLEDWINQMKCEAQYFIEKAKDIHIKLDAQEQEIAAELKNAKEQEMSWQDTLQEFQKMAKIDMDVLIAEKVFSHKEENQSHTWCKSISWKMENIKKCLDEYQNS